MSCRLFLLPFFNTNSCNFSVSIYVLSIYYGLKDFRLAGKNFILLDLISFESLILCIAIVPFLKTFVFISFSRSLFDLKAGRK
jgi:hypothetical protein